jgi:hypothetical protein
MPEPTPGGSDKKMERHLWQLWHHMGMRRSGLLVLMALILSAAVLQAQRAGGGSGSGVHITAGSGIRPGPSNGFFRGHSGGRRHDGFEDGAVWLPWDFPYWDDDYFWGSDFSYAEPPNPPSLPPQVIVVQSKEPGPPPSPPEPPKIIEVPQSKEAPVARQRPPTLFVLKNGERLESHSYLLTVESLQIEVGRQRRTVPLSILDLDATVAANQNRGIELTIPSNRNTVFVGF